MKFKQLIRVADARKTAATMADSTDIDPISIVLVKKGCRSDRLLFRSPYANPTRPSTNSAGPTSSGGGSGGTTAAIPTGLVTNTIILFSFPQSID